MTDTQPVPTQAPPKRGRPSNSDTLKSYRGKVEKARRWRRQEQLDQTWRRLIDMYRGKQFEYLSKEDRLLVNISFSTINVIAPSVAVNYPKITVNATRPEDAPKAIITEAVINYWWRHYKVRPQFRRAVKDFLVIGHGWLKCGYRYVEEESVGGDDEISDPAPEGDEVTPTTVITEDRPFVERVSPFDIFVDPDATSMSEIRWVAQRIKRTLKEVRTDKRYSKVARDNASPTSWNDGIEADRGATDKSVDTDEGYVEVWEFYDINKKSMCVFADGCEHFLVKPIEMPYAFGHPFVMVRNYDVPDHFYPMGDLEAIEPLQRELNETRSQMMNHRKRYARKYLYRESGFSSDGRKGLEDDNDNTMVPVQGDEPFERLIAPMPTVMTPPEFYEQSALIQADVENVSGVSEYQRGGLPEVRRTATEAAIVQDASNARAADKLATIEQSIGEVASRMIQLAQQFMSAEQVARVIGKEGKPLWVSFDADYISGEFDYEVEAGSTAPNNESFRRQMALQMVDAMVPFMVPDPMTGQSVIDPAKLAAHVLQFGFGVKNPESFIKQPMGPPGMAPPGPGDPAAEGGEEAPPEEMMGGDPSGAAMADMNAPPPPTSEALSGIDPGVLAALSTRVGLNTNTL